MTKSDTFKAPFKKDSTIFIVTRHEKTGLMYTKYTHSYKTEYLYLQSANCIRFCRNDCISDVVKFYVHIRPIFSILMPGHNYCFLRSLI